MVGQDLKEWKVRYNRCLKKFEAAGKWFDDPEIPLVTKCKEMDRLALVISAATTCLDEVKKHGGTVTQKEIMQGFKID